MSRRAKRCTVALADVTLLGAGAAITTTWKDPDTINASAPTAVELEYTPRSFSATRTTVGASPGHITVAVSTTGVTITPSTAADTGVFRVEAAIDPSER